jgi:hypothetical protein
MEGSYLNKVMLPVFKGENAVYCALKINVLLRINYK